MPMTLPHEEPKPSLTLCDLVDPLDLPCRKVSKQTWTVYTTGLSMGPVVDRSSGLHRSVHGVYCSYRKMRLGKRSDRHTLSNGSKVQCELKMYWSLGRKRSLLC